MTEAPKTLALNARQWRVLLHDHLDVMKGAVQSTEGLSEEALQNMYRHLDEMKMQATAWFQVSVAAPAAAPDAPAAVAQTNGAAAPKKTGGWPLGKKRGRKQPEAMQ